jgi:hypothetical protein
MYYKNVKYLLDLLYPVITLFSYFNISAYFEILHIDRTDLFFVIISSRRGDHEKISSLTKIAIDGQVCLVFFSPFNPFTNG